MKKLLFFRADWCDPCRRMSPEVEAVFNLDAIKDLYSLERIDIDQEPERAARYGIRGLPAFIVLDENCFEISRRIGLMPRHKLIDWLAFDNSSPLKLALKAPAAMLSSFFSEKCKVGDRRAESEEFIRTCPDTIYFAPDSAEINNAAAGDLFKQLEWIKKHQWVYVLIEGHCDGTGDREYNLMLGEKRAQAVKDFFNDHAVLDHTVGVVSYGKERPRVHENSDQDRAFNRRALTRIQ